MRSRKPTGWSSARSIPDETSEFWRAPGTTPEEMKKIQTTVYRLPCAGFAEKDGTFVNSARWLQWKNAALPPPGDARLDQDILAQIFLRVRDLYSKEGGDFPDPILNLTLAVHAAREPVARRGGARDQRPGARRHHRSRIRADDQGRPAAARLRLAERRRHHAVWQLVVLRIVDRRRAIRWRVAAPTIRPVSASIRTGRGRGRRIAACMYNRASCDPAGKPWDPERRQVWWNEARRTMGRQRRARLQGRLEAGGSHGPVHHEPGRRRPPFRAARGVCRTDRSPSTTSRSRVRSPIRFIRSSPTIRW